MIITTIFCILISFIMVGLPTSFILPTTISEINTKGSVPYVALMFILVCAGAAAAIICTVLQLKHRLNKKKERIAFETKQEQKSNEMLTAMNNNRSEFSTTIQDGQILDTGETVNTNPKPNTIIDTSVERTARKIAYGISKARDIYRLCIAAFVSLLTIFALYNSIDTVVNLEKVSLYRYELESIPTYADMYIHSTTSSFNSSLIDGEWTYTYYQVKYETNGLTDELYNGYTQYLIDQGFTNYFTEFYYLKNPNDDKYIYKVTLDKYDNDISVTYEYVKKPSIYM